MTPKASVAREDVEERIDDQSDWLAANTVLSERQAEAAVRDAISGDAPQLKVSKSMDIEESTVSNHLHAVDEATDPDTAAMAYWLFFGPGPINPVTYQAIPVWTNGSSEWVVIFQQQFPEHANSYAPEYYVIHQHVDRNAMDDLDDVAVEHMADPRFRHITDQYEFDSLGDLQAGLPRAVEFDSERKREQFEEMFAAYCQVNAEATEGTDDPSTQY